MSELSAYSDDELMAIAGGSVSPMSMRQNNPGNMRSSSGEFQRFDTPEAGLDAMHRDLMLKISGSSPVMKAHYGQGYKPTLRNVISTWAPPTENNTNGYIDFVAQHAGLDPDQPLSIEDVSKIMLPMVHMEGGQKASQYFGKLMGNLPIGKQYADSGEIKTDAQVDAGSLSDMSDEELMKIAGEDSSQNQDFMSRVSQDVFRRANEGADAIVAYKNKEQGLGQTALQLVGKMGAGTASDIVGEAVKSAATSLPDFIKEPVSETAAAAKDYILSTDIGKMGLEAAKSGMEAYGQWATENPNAARSLESVVDIGSFLAGAKASSPALGAVEDAVNLATPVAKSALKKIEPILQSAESGVRLENTIPGVGNLAKQTVSEGKNAVRGIPTLFKDTASGLDTTAESLQQIGTNLYAKSREVGAILKPQVVRNMGSRILHYMDKLGPNNSELHKGTLAVLRQFHDAVKAGEVDSLESLDNYRKLFSQVTTRQYGKVDALKSQAAIEAIDDAVQALGKNSLKSGSLDAVNALLDARTQWGVYKRYDAIANIVKNADGDPATIKRGIANFIKNPKNLRGFSDAQKKALTYASKYSTMEGLIAAFGKLGFDPVSLKSAGASALPALFTGILASPATAVAGTAARMAQKTIGRTKALDALKLIESGSRKP